MAHLKQMDKLPKMTLLSEEEQQLYPEPLTWSPRECLGTLQKNLISTHFVQDLILLFISLEGSNINFLSLYLKNVTKPYCFVPHHNVHYFVSM